MLEFFSNNKGFSSDKKLEDNYKNNVEKKSFWNSQKILSLNSDKTQDNGIIITQHRYEVYSYESVTNGCNTRFFFIRKFFFSLRRMNQTICAKKHQTKKHQVSHPVLKTFVKMSFTKELWWKFNNICCF